MQTSAVSCSWSLQLDNRFAFGAMENEQQHGIDSIDGFSLTAFRTDMCISVAPARKKIVQMRRLEVQKSLKEAVLSKEKQVEWVRFP